MSEDIHLENSSKIHGEIKNLENEVQKNISQTSENINNMDENISSRKRHNVPLDEIIAEEVIKKYNILTLRGVSRRGVELLYYDDCRYVLDEHGYQTKTYIKDLCIFHFDNAVNFFENLDNNDEVYYYDNELTISRKIADQYLEQVGYLNKVCKNIYLAIVENSNIMKMEADFDVDHSVINTPNGVLDLITRQVSPHHPSQLLRLVTNGNYLPNSTESDFPVLYVKILSDALYDTRKTPFENDEMVKSVLAQFGYMLTGGNPEKAMFVYVGPTDSGKSTEISIRAKILGRYMISINAKALMRTSRSKSEIRADFLAIRNARIVTAIETERKDKFDSTSIKSLTGNDEQSYRKAHGDLIYFRMKGKIALLTNEFPAFSDINDRAFLRRLTIVQYKNSVPRECIDPDLDKKLTTQEMMDKIFTLLANYASDYLNSGKLHIAEAFNASKDFIILSQSDLTTKFWNANVTLRPVGEPSMCQMKYPGGLIYSAAFIPFCKSLGVPPITLTAFGTKFKELADCYPGVKRVDGHNFNYYIGIDVDFKNMEALNKYTFETWLGGTA